MPRASATGFSIATFGRFGGSTPLVGRMTQGSGPFACRSGLREPDYQTRVHESNWRRAARDLFNCCRGAISLSKLPFQISFLNPMKSFLSLRTQGSSRYRLLSIRSSPSVNNITLYELVNNLSRLYGSVNAAHYLFHYAERLSSKRSRKDLCDCRCFLTRHIYSVHVRYRL